MDLHLCAPGELPACEFTGCKDPVRFLLLCIDGDCHYFCDRHGRAAEHAHVGVIVSECSQIQVECFTYHPHEAPNEPMMFNIEQAKHEIVAGNVNGVAVVPLDALPDLVRNMEFSEAHLASVDENMPGIAVELRVAGGLHSVLIDGTHRCVKSLRAGREYKAIMLTHEATRRCLVSGPERFLP